MTANSENKGKALVWLCPSLLVWLLLASNSKESGLTTSSSKLKYLYKSKRNKEMKIVLYNSSEPPLNYRVDNKRPASVAAISQWPLPFCIALCSVDLFGSVVEPGLVFNFDDDGGWGIPLCKRRSGLLNTEMLTIRLSGDSKIALLKRRCTQPKWQ